MEGEAWHESFRSTRSQHRRSATLTTETTLTQALSGVWTDTHSEERKRGISVNRVRRHGVLQGRQRQYYATGKRPDGGDDVEASWNGSCPLLMLPATRR